MKRMSCKYDAGERTGVADRIERLEADEKKKRLL